MKRLAALAALAGAYVLAAWTTVPGFYDGFAPPAAYNWVSPPPDFRAANRPPAGGSTAVGVASGASRAGAVATADSQATVTFPVRSFEVPPGGGSISLDVEPVGTHPDLRGIAAASNVYLVSASTRLVSSVLVTLRYVQLRPDPPDHLYVSAGPAQPWKSLALVPSPAQDTLSASSGTLGYFVIGYVPAAPSGSGPGAAAGGGGIGLPAVVGLAVAIIVLAGLPIALARRRADRSVGRGTEPQPPAPRNLGGAKRSRRRRGRR